MSKWIRVDKDPVTGLMTFAIDARTVASYQELDGEHYLILAERPSEKHPTAEAAVARLLDVLREEDGDVGELRARVDGPFTPKATT